MTQETTEVKQEIPPISFAEFLETSPPSRVVIISEYTSIEDRGGPHRVRNVNVVAFPEIQLHCNDENCNGMRFFRLHENTDIEVGSKGYKYFYVTYICSNCRKNTKTFSLACIINKGQNDGSCYKFGEMPTYGPPVSSKLIKLIGPDRDLFLKGRTCENQGLGVGAFGYYRRVIENQKNRIFDEIIKVAKKIGAEEGFLAQIENAKSETQFSKAVSQIKSAIPQALLINGHNPLTLLHTALSNGLHDRSDNHCIELAGSIRVVLGELSERLSQALKDEHELANALGKLLNLKK